MLINGLTKKNLDPKDMAVLFDRVCNTISSKYNISFLKENDWDKLVALTLTRYPVDLSYTLRPGLSINKAQQN